MNWFECAGVRSDVRYGARMLGRDRGFAAVAIMTIALAIGLATTLFSVFDAVSVAATPVATIRTAGAHDRAPRRCDARDAVFS